MLTKREYKELYLSHHQKADAGNVESQFKLGEYYEHGKGVMMNKKLAEFWYQKAVEGKHPMALFNLNWMRLKESGTAQNEGHLNLLIGYKFDNHKHEQNCRCLMSLLNTESGVDAENTNNSLDFLHCSSPLRHY